MSNSCPKSFTFNSPMNTIKLNYIKTHLSKSLLAGIILLSVFAFTGAGGRSNSLQEKTRIEWVCSVSKKTTGQTTSYKRLLIPGYRAQCFNTSILLHCNRQAKIKFTANSKKLYSVPNSVGFIPIKTIPVSLGEDPLISITG
jgi:hypothetical protein